MFPFLAGAGLFFAIVLLRVFMRRVHATETRQQRVQLLRTWTLYGLAVLILLLAITGRLHWVFALFSAVLPWFGRYLSARNLWQEYQIKQAEKIRRREEAKRQASEIRQVMSKEEALRILGLEPGASREEIIEAHRHLMARVHPDKGGSDELAQRINTARQVLLGE